MRTAVVNRTARGESHWLFKERKSPASSGQSFISDRNKPGAVIGCRFLTKLEGVSIFRRSGPQTCFRRDFVSLSSRRKCKIEGPGRPRVIALTHRYLHSASSLLPQGHHVRQGRQRRKGRKGRKGADVKEGTAVAVLQGRPAVSRWSYSPIPEIACSLSPTCGCHIGGVHGGNPRVLDRGGAGVGGQRVQGPQG